MGFTKHGEGSLLPDQQKTSSAETDEAKAERLAALQTENEDSDQ